MGVQKLKSGVAYTADAPAEKKHYTCSPSICKCQPALQILTFRLMSFGDTKGVPK